MSDGPGRKPTITDEEILDIFKSATEPVLTAGEVSDQLPITRRGTLDRLRDLEAEEIIKSKKVGGRSKVWWYPGHTSTSPSEHPDDP